MAKPKKTTETPTETTVKRYKSKKDRLYVEGYGIIEKGPKPLPVDVVDTLLLMRDPSGFKTEAEFIKKFLVEVKVDGDDNVDAATETETEEEDEEQPTE